TVERTVGTGYRRVAGERDVRLRRWIRGVACAAAGERIRLAAGVQQRQGAAGGDGQPSVTARPGQVDHRGSPSPPCSSSPAGRPTPPATSPTCTTGSPSPGRSSCRSTAASTGCSPTPAGGRLIGDWFAHTL